MLKSRIFVAARVGLLVSTALLHAVPAFAQSAPAPQSTDAPEAEQERHGGLEDIVVTARKRVENLQNIPIIATVMSQRQIESYQITSVEKISTLAPQLVVGRNGTGNGAAIGLRGISVNATSISLEQSVATVIDGVYYSGGRSLNVGLFDLARVELLKGPQSLFYGKNTTAGAISITTADPTSKFEALARVGYEFSAEQPYVEGVLSGPVSDTLSVRLAARYSDQLGALIKDVTRPGVTYTRDVVTGISTAHPYERPPSNVPGERNFVVRGGIKWEPTDEITAVWKNSYNVYHSNGPNSSTVIGYCISGVVQSDPTAPCGHKFVQVQSPLPSDIVSGVPVLSRHGGDSYLDYYQFNSTLNASYNTHKVTYSLIAGYTSSQNYWLGDFDFTDHYLDRAPALGTGGNNTGTAEKYRAFSVEARAQTKFSGDVNFMVGGYYQNTSLGYHQYQVYPGGPENSAAPLPYQRYLTNEKVSHADGKTYAVFGQVLWDMTPKLNFTAGIRYSKERKDSILSQLYVNPVFLSSLVPGTLTQPDQTFSNASPEATVTWKAAPNATLFASFRTGYKSGGFSISGNISPTSTAADATFQPEKASGFEGGLKSTLFDNQLRFNLSGFWYTYKGLQVDYVDPATIKYLTTNAAQARTRGFELETEFAPRGLPGLTLRGSAAFTDAIYESFPQAPCVGGQTPADGCNLKPNALGVFTAQNLSGNHTPQAPKWAATLGGDYYTPVGDNLKIGLSGNLRYSGRYKIYSFAPDNAARFFQTAYAAIDASVSLARGDDRWQVQLIGKNLTNHFIETTGFDLTYTGARAGTPTGIPSDGRTTVYDPRTVALQLTVRY